MTELLIYIPLIVIIVLLSHKIYRGLRYSEHINWLPRHYINLFKGSTDEKFREKNELPTDIPVLLIVARLRSGYKLIKLIDYLANLITFGWIRFHEIITIDKPCKLKLYYKNLSADKKEFEIDNKLVKFVIRYPSDPPPTKEQISASRKWSFPIPSLSPGESKTITIDKFFAPEVPGDHQLIILEAGKIRYMSLYGLCGRDYKDFGVGDSWSQLFHVSSTYEYKVFVIVFITLLASLLSLLVSSSTLIMSVLRNHIISP